MGCGASSPSKALLPVAPSAGGGSGGPEVHLPSAQALANTSLVSLPGGDGTASLRRLAPARNATRNSLSFGVAQAAQAAQLARERDREEAARQWALAQAIVIHQQQLLLQQQQQQQAADGTEHQLSDSDDGDDDDDEGAEAAAASSPHRVVAASASAAAAAAAYSDDNDSDSEERAEGEASSPAATPDDDDQSQLRYPAHTDLDPAPCRAHGPAQSARWTARGASVKEGQRGVARVQLER